MADLKLNSKYMVYAPDEDDRHAMLLQPSHQPGRGGTALTTTGIVVAIVVAAVALTMAGVALWTAHNNRAPQSVGSELTTSSSHGQVLSLASSIVSGHPACTANVDAWKVCTDMITRIGDVLPVVHREEDVRKQMYDTNYTSSFAFGADGVILAASPKLNMLVGATNKLTDTSTCDAHLGGIFCLKIHAGTDTLRPVITFLFMATDTTTPKPNEHRVRRWSSIFGGVTICAYCIG